MKNLRRNPWRMLVWLLLGLFVVVVIYWCFREFCAIPDRSLLAVPLPTVNRWQSIIPGQTSKEQALNILGSSPYVRRASITVYPGGKLQDGSKFQSIRWDNKLMSFVPPHWLLSNHMVLLDDKVVVVAIYLNYHMTAEQAIAHFGEPERIARGEGVARNSAYDEVINLLYPDKGLILTCRGNSILSGDSIVGQLVPGSPVVWAYHFESMSLDELGRTAGSLLDMDLNHMEDWAGYDSAPNP